MRLLIVSAVDAERDAVRAGLPDGCPAITETVGVGPAAAAAGTAWLLAHADAARRLPDAVVCAGIAGGFTGRIALGGTALGARSVAADLGAVAPEHPGGFASLEDLGFGSTRLGANPELLAALVAALPGAVTGDVLTVSTVTGTAAGAADLAGRHPAAVAEAMEGFGVAVAAARAGVPFVEVRTVSNLVGPRDRAAWRIGAALEALGMVGAALGRLAG